MSLTFKEIMERDKKETLDYHNFKEWHDAGYKGQGFNFLEIEDDGGHGKMVMDVVREYAPECGKFHGTMSHHVKGDEVLFCHINYEGEQIPIKDFIKKYNIHVIGASLGFGGSGNSDGYPQPLIDYLKELPVIWVGSAGNDGGVGVTGVFEYLGIMSGAIYLDNGDIRKESYSAVEDTMDFATLHSWAEGTSFSSPVLISMILVIMSKYGFITQKVIKEALISICIDAGEEGHDPRFGYGVPILPETLKIGALEHIKQWTFRLLHLASYFDLSVGDLVTKGMLIGRMGKSGTNAYHVHADAVEGIHTQYSMMMIENGLLMPLPTYIDRLITWDLFKYAPVISGNYLLENYKETYNVPYEHWGKDLVPENRKITNENFDIYYPLDTPGVVLNVGEYRDGTKYIIIGVDEMANFTDVKPDAWYAEEVDYVTDMGLMSGYPDGTFKPDKGLTRAEMAQILYNMEHK